jgi:chaperone LolA
MTNFLIALAVCFSGAVTANAEFSDFFNSFETLSADFTQQTYGDSNRLLTKTSGHLYFKRPASFIWQTDTPIEQTLLLNNNELWLVDTELEQASRSDMSNLNNTPLYWLVNRPEQLKSLPQYDHNESGVNWYKTNQENQLSFGFHNNKLSSLRLINQLGQRIHVIFSALTLNPKLGENTFVLDLNSDFDVIR